MPKYRTLPTRLPERRHFFVPEAETTEEAEQFYLALRKIIAEREHDTLKDRRIQLLRFRDRDGRGNAYATYALVGEKYSGEVVWAIFEGSTRGLYYVCTPNRGMRGGPYLVRSDEVIDVAYFQPSAQPE